MKKFISVLLSLLIFISLTACIGENSTVPVQDYPLKNETVTDILHANGFDLNTYVSFYEDSDKTGYTYNYAIDSFDENGNCAGEVSVYGTLKLEWGGEDGKSVKMICMEEESEFADISNFDNLKKSVYTACDAYGGIENKKQIADDFVAAIKDGKIFEYDWPVWEAEYNGIYVYAEFFPAYDDMSVIFRQFEVYDRERKSWYDNRWERTLQTYVDMNPYMYTLETLDHPAPPDKEQATGLIADNSWDIGVSSVINEEQVAGVERHFYYLALPGQEQETATVVVHYNKSGKSVSFNYHMENNDIYNSDEGFDFAVKTTCAFYGGVEDVDGLVKKVETAVDGKNFEYNQYGDPMCLIEHNGKYCLLHFGINIPKVYQCYGLTIYDKNSLQAGIYIMTKTDNWFQKIYSDLYE